MLMPLLLFVLYVLGMVLAAFCLMVGRGVGARVSHFWGTLGLVIWPLLALCILAGLAKGWFIAHTEGASR